MKPDLKPYEGKMQKSLDVLAENLAGIRAGRANASVLNKITVDYYGTASPIQQVAAVASPDPRTLTIQPWVASLLKEIVKAIQTSELGINPQNDGKLIRLSFPPLTEERRKELIKQVSKEGEASKVAIRNIRRDADGQDTCVVLLHDTKATGQTVKALPDMIAYFREQGYNFCTVAQMDALQCETK